MKELTESQVYREAATLLLDGAESYWEDWLDEDGEFTDDDAERVYDAAGEILSWLRRLSADE